MPSPQYELWRLSTSPVPTHTMLGLDGATDTEPIELIPFALSNTGSHVVPQSVVFQTPPMDIAAYSASGVPGVRAAAKSALRPLWLAGPMLRRLRPFSAVASSGFCAGSE